MGYCKQLSLTCSGFQNVFTLTTLFRFNLPFSLFFYFHFSLLLPHSENHLPAQVSRMSLPWQLWPPGPISPGGNRDIYDIMRKTTGPHKDDKIQITFLTNACLGRWREFVPNVISTFSDFPHPGCPCRPSSPKGMYDTPGKFADFNFPRIEWKIKLWHTYRERTRWQTFGSHRKERVNPISILSTIKRCEQRNYE